jgi:hypothetical protein
MDPIVALLAQLAALLSGTGGADSRSERPQVEASADAGVARLAPRPEPSESMTAERGWVSVTEGFEVPVQNQVRIERSITIRITPRAPPQADLPRFPQETASNLVERRMGSCVPVRGIAGVQVSRDNRLLLFMRDDRIVSLGLEKGCRAKDFYLGFYVERQSDGQICVDRDRLQSRSGANCALTRMRQLVEE